MLIILKPKNVTFSLNEQKNILSFKSLLGKSNLFLKNIEIEEKKNSIIVNSKNKKYEKLYFQLIKNKLKGLCQYFRQSLLIKGVGYRFILDELNKKLLLKVGFSHIIEIKIPNNIIVSYLGKNKIIFKSIDLESLTQFIYYIQNFKKPNIYTGKGILIKGKKIKIKKIKKK